MPGKKFSESGLSFLFPEDWLVFKYDEHRFYTYLSGAGLKGVDFIAIHQSELILVEVKNYSDRIIKEGFDPMEGLLTEPETYAEAYYRKFEDTFRLLDIIEQYYNRKWWYRNIFQRFKGVLSTKEHIKTETGFWSRAIEILDKLKGVRLVLWLEFDPRLDAQTAKQLYDYFQKEIQAKSPEGVLFSIAHSKQPFPGIKAT